MACSRFRDAADKYLDVTPVTGRFLFVRPTDSGLSPRAVRMVLNWTLDLPAR
jgi:hypothetical protein